MALALAPILNGCATTQTSAIHEALVPSEMESLYQDYHFAPAVRAGDFLYLSGVIASARDGGADTEAKAYDLAFQEIEGLLNLEGASWEHVVEIETFHTDLPSQMSIFVEVKDRYILEPYPAWTAVDVDRLVPENALAEIKVVAYLAAPKTLRIISD